MAGTVSTSSMTNLARPHTVSQAEGGGQGDPLMPGLFAVSIHRTLQTGHSTFCPGEDLYAFLDDTYITCPAERAVPSFRALRTALAEHANIDLNLGKTRVWNAAGEEPEGLAAELPPLPGRPPVWAGTPFRPAEQQGMVVLGTPMGSDAFVDAFVKTKTEVHATRPSSPKFPNSRRSGPSGGLVAVAHVCGSAVPLPAPQPAALLHGGPRPPP